MCVGGRGRRFCEDERGLTENRDRTVGRCRAGAKEVELQKSAPQVCAQRPLDEARDGASLGLAERQEGLELLEEHSIERRLLRVAAARLWLVRSAVGVGGERELAPHTRVDCEARALLRTGERCRGGRM